MKNLEADFNDLIQNDIKYQNDLLLSCNKKIEGLRQDIASSKADSEKRLSYIKRDFEDTLLAIEEIKNYVTLAICKMQSEMNESLAIYKSDMNAFQKKLLERESDYLTVDGFQHFRSKIDEWVANIKRAFHSQKDIYQEKSSESAQELKKYVDSLIKNVYLEIDKLKGDK